MNNIKILAAFAVFSLVLSVTAFSQTTDIPNTARGVLGRGYDVTGSYAEPLEIKRQVLNLDKLIAEKRVERNYNIERSSFTTVTGKDIAEYTKNLTQGTGRSVNAGVNIFGASLSFSREVSSRFGSERVNRSEYEFATRSSNIIKGAYYIDGDNLSRYVNDTFVNDVKTMIPQQIIDRYGTHVMLGALLGARLDYNMSVRRKSQTGSETVANLVTTSFDARFRGIGGGASFNTQLESRYGQTFDINSMNMETKVIGGRSEFAQSIHNNQEYDAWINSIEGREIWSGYYPDSLVPIYELITTELFGARTQALKDALRYAIDNHLSPPVNMMFINGGTFTMGSPADEEYPRGDGVPSQVLRINNAIQHQVTLSSFYMSKYEVTQKEYQEIMGTNPSNFKGDNLPVEQVTWFDAIEYCNKRSQKEGLTPAYTITGRTPSSGYPITAAQVTWNRIANGYRLPTQAEWEYACRAGTTTPFNTGNNITTNQANYDGNYPYNNNTKGQYRQRTTPVGTFPSNAWGLHDMHGNVWEWCWDWYGPYAVGAQTDPMGASSGSDRVMRGGGWFSHGRHLRSAVRGNYVPSDRNVNLGFRLVRP